MIDQLAEEYASRAIFIEYNLLADNAADRLDRWWAASGSTSASLPLTMVDSGYKWHSGFSNYSQSYTIHKSMVDDALARPPEADVSATYTRVGDAVRFNVRVTNHSGITLDNTNYAAVHVIVYEDSRVQYTGRFMRAHAATPIASLDDDATGDFVVNTSALSGVDWSKLHFIALVDYVTDTGAYDMLQAAVATPTLIVTPVSLTFSAPVGGSAPVAQTLSVNGVTGAAWTVAKSASWLQISPTSGVIPALPQVTINPAGLARGVYGAKLTFSAGITQDVNVIAVIGDVNWSYLPFVIR